MSTVVVVGSVAGSDAGWPIARGRRGRGQGGAAQAEQWLMLQSTRRATTRQQGVKSQVARVTDDTEENGVSVGLRDTRQIGSRDNYRMVRMVQVTSLVPHRHCNATHRHITQKRGGPLLGLANPDNSCPSRAVQLAPFL